MSIALIPHVSRKIPLPSQASRKYKQVQNNKNKLDSSIIIIIKRRIRAVRLFIRSEIKTIVLAEKTENESNRTQNKKKSYSNNSPKTSFHLM